MKADFRLFALLTVSGLVLTACMDEPEPADMTPMVDDYGDTDTPRDESGDAVDETMPEEPQTVALMGVAEPAVHGDWFAACNDEGACEAATFVYNGGNRALFAVGRNAGAEDYYLRFSTSSLGVIEGPFGWVIENQQRQQFRSNSYEDSRYASNYGEVRSEGFMAALDAGETLRFAIIRDNVRTIYEISPEGFSDAIDAIAPAAE